MTGLRLSLVGALLRCDMDAVLWGFSLVLSIRTLSYPRCRFWQADMCHSTEIESPAHPS